MYSLPNVYSPTDQAIKDIFGNVDTNVDRVQLLDRVYWSRLTFAATNSIDENSTKFFGTITNTNLRDTNWPSNDGTLPSPNMLAIRSIGFYLPPNTAEADALALFDSLALVLKIRSTEVYNAPLHTLSPGSGPSFFSTTTVAATTKTYITNGTPGRSGMHVMDIPIVIPPNTKLEIFLKGTAVVASATCKPEVLLRGPALSGV